MQLHQLKLDSTRLYMTDIHGKQYPIKKQRGRYYIQHAAGQLTVTSIMSEVVPNDGSLQDYIFNGWFMQYNTFELYKSFMESELNCV